MPHRAHDLANLLGIISCNAELMITAEPPIPERFNARVMSIYSAVKRAVFIVSAMKATDYPIVPNLGTLELVTLAQAIKAELQRRAGPEMISPPDPSGLNS